MIGRIDSHTHLNHDDLYPDWQTHLDTFTNQGGYGLVNIGVNRSYNQKGLNIAQEAVKTHPQLWIKATLGIHPYEIAIGEITASTYQAELDEIRSAFVEHREDVVAIGEIGIDTYYPNTDHTLELQKAVFRQQCQLARELDVPIVIHSRANRPATHEVLQEFTDLCIYFHCRSYTPKEVKIIQETYPRFFIGFGGNTTYPKAIDIRQSLWYLLYHTTHYPDQILTGKIDPNWKSTTRPQLNHLVLETDAPYLAPQMYRGQQNLPHYVAEVYRYISKLYDISLEELSNQIARNNHTLYNMPL